MVKSASLLGLHSDHVVLINDKALPDSPSVEWNEDIIGNHILKAIKRNGIKMVRIILSQLGNRISVY